MVYDQISNSTDPESLSHVGNHKAPAVEYDERTPDDLSEHMGYVNPKNPLAGLEHFKVLDRDIDILTQKVGPSADMTWEEVTNVVQSMELYKFTRRPHDLRNYLRWKYVTDRDYSEIDPKTGEKISGILMYILKVRIEGRWGSVLPLSKTIGSRKLFEDVDKDVCILWNDFPYAFEKGIFHVVVWLRTPIPIEAVEPSENGTSEYKGIHATTQLTKKSKALVDMYVKVNFTDNLGMKPEDVLWFKNWAALQSIPAMEHFHVLLYNPPMDKLEKLYGTGGKPINIEI